MLAVDRRPYLRAGHLPKTEVATTDLAFPSMFKPIQAGRANRARRRAQRSNFSIFTVSRSGSEFAAELQSRIRCKNARPTFGIVVLPNVIAPPSRTASGSICMNKLDNSVAATRLFFHDDLASQLLRHVLAS